MMKKGILIVCMMLGLAAFAQPTAENVSILGSGLYNSTTAETTTLTGFYYFNAEDPANDVENGTTYQWYRNGSVITGATANTYTLTADDVAKAITFQVVPVANGDTDNAGPSVTSDPVTIASTSLTNYEIGNKETLSLSSDADYLNMTGNNNASGLTVDSAVTVHIYGDLDLTNVTKFVMNVAGALVIHGKVIVNNQFDLDVASSGSLSVESGVDAGAGADLDVSGNVTVGGDVSLAGTATLNMDTDGVLDISGDFDLGTTTVINTMLGSEIMVGGDLLAKGSGASVNGDGTLSVAGYTNDMVTVAPSVNNSTTLLPIELTTFTANVQSGSVQVFWSTASEENNDYFTLERSVDGVSFEEIYYEAGAGNSSVTLSYNYSDMPEAAGMYYYRLKQTDYDGACTYSDVVSVNFALETVRESAQVWVSGAGLHIAFEESVRQVNVQLVNLAGQLLGQESFNEGANFQINTQNLQTGLTLVILRSGEELLKTQKVFIP